MIREVWQNKCQPLKYSRVLSSLCLAQGDTILPSRIRITLGVFQLRYTVSFTVQDVLGITLNCIHIFIVTGRFLYWCVMRPASQRFFIRSCIYLRILIIPYLATFLGTSSLSVLICRKAVNQSITVQARYTFEFSEQQCSQYNTGKPS